MPQPTSTPQRGYTSLVRRELFTMIALVTALICLSAISLAIGSADLSIADVLTALANGPGDAYEQLVVWDLRMPRVLTALIGGAALALAGCAFQAVLRNPLASASTLGISQGAAFGASIAIIALGAGSQAAAYEGALFFSSPKLTALCAFLGGASSTAAILALSRFRNMTPESIVLAGIALSALFSGSTALIQYFAEDTQVAAVVFWTFGDLSRVTYHELPIIAFAAAITGLFLLANRWSYNAIEAGEGIAHGLGVRTGHLRLATMVAGTLAASSVIAFCGTINFVGLAAPHIMRRIVGYDYRFLLPESALAGSAILLLADLVARQTVPSVVLPIGAITSLAGAPLFLYLLARGVRR